MRDVRNLCVPILQVGNRLWEMKGLAQGQVTEEGPGAMSALRASGGV